jgi:hypothetical protein
MGISSNQFEQLKKSLEQGDISNTLEFLKRVLSPHDLDAIREQKTSSKDS